MHRNKRKKKHDVTVILIYCSFLFSFFLSSPCERIIGRLEETRLTVHKNPIPERCSRAIWPHPDGPTIVHARVCECTSCIGCNCKWSVARKTTDRSVHCFRTSRRSSNMKFDRHASRISDYFWFSTKTRYPQSNASLKIIYTETLLKH